MLCDGNRDAYCAAVSGGCSAAAQAFGGPLPEYAAGPANLPLRLRLGQLARLVLAGEIAAGQWAAATSLVAAGELPALVAGDRRAELLRVMGLA